MTELYSNKYIAFIQDDIDGIETEITVDIEPPAALLVAGEWRLKIGANEIVKVTGVNGAILTIERGQENTSAQPHLAGTRVSHVLTAESLNNILEDNIHAHFPLLDEGDHVIEASKIDVTAVDNIVSTDVQAALEEIANPTYNNALAHLVTQEYSDDTYIPLSDRGIANGIATLTADGLVPSTQLPPFEMGEVYTANSESAMLSLDATPGSIAIRTDISTVFVLSALPASELTNWIEVSTGVLVNSVDGRVGIVTLSDLYDAIGSAAAAEAAAISTAQNYADNNKLDISSNLSDLNNVITARTNLELGSAALEDTSAFDATGSATAAQAAAQNYADSLSVNYDPVGTAYAAVEDHEAHDQLVFSGFYSTIHPNKNAQQLSRAGVRSVLPVTMTHNGYISGVSSTLTKTRSAGTVSFIIYKNSGATALIATLNSNHNYVWEAPEGTFGNPIYSFVAGDQLDIRYTSSADLAWTGGGNPDAEAILYVVYEDES